MKWSSILEQGVNKPVNPQVSQGQDTLTSPALSRSRHVSVITSYVLYWTFYIHVHTFTYMYIHLHTCTYMYIHVHTCTYMYIHVYAYSASGEKPTCWACCTPVGYPWQRYLRYPSSFCFLFTLTEHVQKLTSSIPFTMHHFLFNILMYTFVAHNLLFSFRLEH